MAKNKTHTHECMQNWSDLNKLCGFYQCQFSGCYCTIAMQDVTSRSSWVKDYWDSMYYFCNSLRIFNYVKIKSQERERTSILLSVLVAQSGPTPCDPMDSSPPRSSSPWNSPGQNTGVGCYSFLQASFQPRV